MICVIFTIYVLGFQFTSCYFYDVINLSDVDKSGSVVAAFLLCLC